MAKCPGCNAIITTMTHDQKEQTPMFILSGGLSSRFGTDKALAHPDHQDQKSMIEIIASKTPFHDKPKIMVNRFRKYPNLNLEQIVDVYPQKGPMGGIYTALLLAESNHALIVTCDMPMITELILKALVDSWQNHPTDVLCYTIKDRIHPFPGIYSNKIIPSLQLAIESDKLGLVDFILHQTDSRFIEFNEKNCTSAFINVNTQNDLNTLNRTNENKKETTCRCQEQLKF